MKSPGAMCLLVLACLTAGSVRAERTELATHVLELSGRRAGMCSMPFEADPALAAAIAEQSRLTVHAMSAEEKSVARAQAELAESGLLGRSVYFEQGSPEDVPLADWYADLLLLTDIADADLSDLPRSEFKRLLSPYRGVAVVGRSAGSDKALAKSTLKKWAEGFGWPTRVVEDDFGLWAIVRRPPLEGADEWTHRLYGPGNNPVCKDRLVKPPFDIQYVSPQFIGMGVNGTWAAGGRLFEAQGHFYKHGPSRHLVGKFWVRNAYNGEVLWEMDLPKYVDPSAQTMIATADALYMINEDRPGVLVFDPETGQQKRVLSFSGVEGQCKWIALEDGTLYALLGKPVVARSQHSHRPLIKNRESEKLCFGTQVAAYSLEAGKALWTHKVQPEKVIEYRTMGVADGKLFFLEEDKTYRFDKKSAREEVLNPRMVCLDGGTGEVRWANTDEALQRLHRVHRYKFGRLNMPRLICTPQIVRLRLMFWTGQNDIMFFDPADGRLLWSLPARHGERHPPAEHYAGFVHDGGYVHRAREYDLLTGEELTEERSEHLAWSGGCGVRTLAPGGIFGNSGAGTEMAVKAGCEVGSLPALGLLNVPRGWCHCNPVRLGTFAFAHQGEGREADRQPRLRVGLPDPGDVSPLSITKEDWPTYRHDPDRTAHSPVAVSEHAGLLWHHKRTDPYCHFEKYDQDPMRSQGQPTEPVAAGGILFYGGTDGAVRALEAADGRSVWTYWTAGRIHTPPTVWNDRLYVGSGDGYVYCLEAATGRLLWRFRAAPRDERIMLHGHLQSRWPVLTGVLVREGRACFAAGMTETKGVHVYALDAVTGEVIWQRDDAGVQTDTKEGLTPSGFMTAFKGKLWIRNRLSPPGVFDLETGKQTSLPVADYVAERSYHWRRYFQSIGREVLHLGDGLIVEGGRKMFHELNHREGDRGYPGLNMRQYGPDGRSVYRAKVRLVKEAIIPPAFDERLMVVVPGGYGRYYKMVDGERRRVESPRPRGTQGLMALDAAKVRQMALAALRKSRGFSDEYTPGQMWALNGQQLERGKDVPNYSEMLAATPAFRWQFEDPWIQINAVALAKNAAVITRGIQATDDRGRLVNEYEGWTVAALSREDGSIIWEHDLPGEPMLNGLCIDRTGRVIVSLREGGVVCVGGE